MRNKSCPIVTFQTDGKRKLVPRPRPPLILYPSPQFRPGAALGDPPAGMVNAQKDIARHFFGSNFPRVRLQTVAFLQQVPKTSELGAHRPGTAGCFSLPNLAIGGFTRSIVGPRRRA